MRKVLLAVLAAGALSLVWAVAAMATTVTVVDPTGVFTQPGQNGYVRVSTSEGPGNPAVQACNGNEAIAAGGMNFDGYIFVSPGGNGPAAPTYGNSTANDDSPLDGGAASCPNNPAATGVDP